MSKENEEELKPDYKHNPECDCGICAFCNGEEDVWGNKRNQMKLFEFDDQIEFILGRPSFWCAPIANVLRLDGKQIPNKAEAEQAAVIYWMLQQYGKFGKDWKDAANGILQEIKNRQK